MLSPLPGVRLFVVSRPVRHRASYGDSKKELVLPIRTDLPFKEAKRSLIDPFERAYITWLLDCHCSNLSAASRASGLSRKHIRNLARKHNLGLKPAS